MNIVYRFILFIIILLFMLVSLVFSFYSFGFPQFTFISELISNLYQNWQMGILFIISFAISGWVIYPAFNFNERFETTRIKNTELGYIDISIEALDDLVKKVVNQQEGINDVLTKLTADENGLNIFLNCKVKSEIVIPELADNIQKLTKSYLEDITGVNVNEVRVLIKNISDNNKVKVE